MAPARKTRSVAKQPQHLIFKVTKPAVLNTKTASPSQRKLEAIESVTSAEVEQPHARVAQTQSTGVSRKRRRDTPSTSDSEGEASATQVQSPIKKLKTQQATPPATPRTRRILQPHLSLSTTVRSSGDEEQIHDDVPHILIELQLLHQVLVQSLSIHYAHHGLHKAIAVSELTPTMTRLYKKHAICLHDIARSLAIWELAAQRTVVGDHKELEHNRGPFKLVRNGLGEGGRVVVEFAWAAQSRTYNEQDIQKRYEKACDLLAGLARGQPDSFLWGAVETIPQLQAQTGQQTRQRQEKASTIRDLILNKAPRRDTQQVAESGTDLSFSDLQISTSPKKSAPLQSKTLSLFDRVKARQLFAATTTAPTAAELLRRRALARLADIVDILRLKQAQKHNSQFGATTRDSPSNAASATRTKTCFSLDALVQEIQGSMSVAASAEELRECILILARERDDRWCAVYSSGGVRCVTLQGQGPSGREVKAWAQTQAETAV